MFGSQDPTTRLSTAASTLEEDTTTANTMAGIMAALPGKTYKSPRLIPAPAKHARNKLSGRNARTILDSIMDLQLEI